MDLTTPLSRDLLTQESWLSHVTRFQHFEYIVYLSQSKMTALDIRTLKKVTIRLAETEEMSKVLRSLVAKRIGFKEEEDFLAKEKSKLKGGRSFDDKRRLIKLDYLPINLAKNISLAYFSLFY